MCRSIGNIPDLFREHSEGIGGKPSIMEMDSVGSSWRSAPAERQWYSRRMRIISGVKGFAISRNISIEEAIQILERERLATGKTIDWLGRTYDNFSFVSEIPARQTCQIMHERIPILNSLSPSIQEG